MKRTITLIFTAAALLLCSCQQGAKKELNLTSAEQIAALDLQFWRVLDGDAWQLFLEEYCTANPDAIITADGIVKASDTAQVGAWMRENCTSMRVDYHRLHPAFCPIDDSIFRTLVLYGITDDENNEHPLASSSDITELSVEKTDAEYEMMITFADADLFATITREALGSYIAITSGQEVLSAPRVMGEITNGRIAVQFFLFDERVRSIFNSRLASK